GRASRSTARGWGPCVRGELDENGPAGRGATLNVGGRLMRGRLFGAVAVVLLLAVVMSGGRSPASGQAKPGAKKLDFPHVTAPPESSAVAFKWMSEELTKRSGGALNVVFHGGTLLTKELEIMDAVKSVNVAIGNSARAAC